MGSATQGYRSLGYQRVVLDYRSCGSAVPSVGAVCNQQLCPWEQLQSYTRNGANTSFCTASCAQQCAPGVPQAGSVGGGTNVGVWNTMLASSASTVSVYDYTIRASCSSTFPCFALVPGLGACAGRGSCTALQSAPFASCACAAPALGASVAYGGIGCQVAMTPLPEPSILPSEIAPPGGWRYYSLLSAAGTPLQVELSRHSGDPLLFVMPEGGSPDSMGALPGELTSLALGGVVSTVTGTSAQNAATWGADTDSFFDALDTQYGGWASFPGGAAWAAVYDAGGQGCSYSLQLQPVLCALNCSGNGACGADGTCTCGPTWAGPACASPLVDMGSGGVQTFNLLPARWAYFLIHFPPSASGGNSWSLGGGSSNAPTATITLSRSGGPPPSFLVRQSSPPYFSGAGAGYDLPSDSTNFFTPTRTTADMVAATTVTPTSYTLTIEAEPNAAVYIGLFNFADRSHSGVAAGLQLVVKVTGDTSGSVVTPTFLSIILGIVLSMFLCLLLSLSRRYGLRWIMRRRTAAQWANGLPPGTMVGPDGNLIRIPLPPPRGLSPAVIASFKTHAFVPEAGVVPPAPAAAAEGEPAHAPPPPEEAPSCSVCLCEYEAGETLRTLPLCRHVFHTACIDPWLGQHQTCPLCRVCYAGFEGPDGRPVSPPPTSPQHASLSAVAPSPSRPQVEIEMTAVPARRWGGPPPPEEAPAGGPQSI